MSLETRLTAFATAVGDDVQDLLASIGNLASLNTTAKSSLVAAINEALASDGDGGAGIDDNNVSTGTTYSSDKIVAVVAQAITDFVAGAPGALDTWMEVVTALQDQDSVVAGLVTSLNNRVRYDAAQSLTALQQAQACANIGVGNPEVNLVSAYEAARDGA